jgi:fumarate hydratase subunit beta
MYDFTNLKAGDRLLLTGTILTARDKAHLFLLDTDFPKANSSIIYHCGPIVKDNNILAAGPTTSARMNPYTPKLIEKYDIKAIIGKGGMSKEVLAALRGRAVYFSAIGGAASMYASKMKLKKVHKLEFGMAEAMYELEVKDFPVVVMMDSKGNSIYDDVLEASEKVFNNLVGKI